MDLFPVVAFTWSQCGPSRPEAGEYFTEQYFTVSSDC